MTREEVAPYLRKRVKDYGGICIPLSGHEYPDYLVVLEGSLFFVAFSPTGQYSAVRYEVVKQLAGLGLDVVFINSKRKVETILQEAAQTAPADPQRAENLLEVYRSAQAMIRALDKHQEVIRADLEHQGLGITRDLKLTELD